MNFTQTLTKYLLIGASALSLASCGGDDTTAVAPSGPDTTPPNVSVPTIETAGSQSIIISWPAATDNVSASNAIIYHIYKSDTSGNQDFSIAPDASTLKGETRIKFALDSSYINNTEYFFVVRAEDEAGNEDSNVLESSFVKAGPVSFSNDIQPIFDATCVTSKCHDAATPAAGLDLTTNNALANLVNQPSTECAPERLIVDGSKSPDNSYLVNKITGLSICGGSQMPIGNGNKLSPEQIAAIKNWIWDGAAFN